MKIKLLPLLFLFLIGPVALAQKAEKKQTAETTAKAQDLKALNGNYTSGENPDGILIFEEGGKLMGKIPGQPSMKLEHVRQNTYQSDKGLLLHFVPESKELILQKDRTRQVLKKA
jgi:hypothetical protein